MRGQYDEWSNGDDIELNLELTSQSGYSVALTLHGDPAMPTYTLEYRFEDKPRTFQIALKQPELAAHEAAMHVLQLHFGDGENSLVMPDAQATPEEVLNQAALLGITGVRVVSEGENVLVDHH